MTNIEKPNHNKHNDRQKAYKDLVSCINELALVNSLLDADNQAINNSYIKANKQRRAKLDEAMNINNGIIIANCNRITKLYKEKAVLESRGCS